MSRKRKDRREKERELERQLGQIDQAGGDVPEDLREKLRVTRVSLRPLEVEVESSPRALLGHGPVQVETGIMLVEPQGARWVAIERAEGGAEKSGRTVELEVGATRSNKGHAGKEGRDEGGDKNGDDEGAEGRVRYTRPASFLVFAFRAAERAHWILGSDPAGVELVVDDVVRKPWDPEVLRLPAASPRSVTFRLGTEERAAGLCVLQAVHRVKDTFALPIDDGKRQWKVRVRVST